MLTDEFNTISSTMCGKIQNLGVDALIRMILLYWPELRYLIDSHLFGRIKTIAFLA